MAAVPVLSEIPGTVFKIEAEVGDEVAEDDPVVILESMKMEIPVGAPQAGRVAEILVEEGEAVEEGQEVAVIEA
ncbi:MAG: acetyl-CoA carboxylase biotin carboxyl carrier protein subunit [Alphaproteobacteria bacterium]|nr:acetyl-CoA carboxylase biotin carboxyl carrier protein subunit [Alphaproteobacteria bacterium]